jgi:acyl carrier protein
MKLSRLKLKKHYCDRLVSLYLEIQREENESEIRNMIQCISGGNDSTIKLLEGGLDSISALRFQAMTKSKFNLTIPLEIILSSNTSVNTLVDYVMNPNSANKTIRYLDDDSRVNWNEELRLPKELVERLASSKSPNLYSVEKEAKNIFLTGATGLLGITIN